MILFYKLYKINAQFQISIFNNKANNNIKKIDMDSLNLLLRTISVSPL